MGVMDSNTIKTYRIFFVEYIVGIVGREYWFALPPPLPYRTKDV